MVDIYGSHFEYAGVSSRKYGLIIANAETKRNTNLSGSIKGVTVFNKATKSVSLVDNDYSGSPVSIDIEIVTDDAQPIGRSEMREIEKWLFNRANYRKLYLDEHDDIYGETYEIIDGEQKRLYLNCRFVNPSRLEYNNGVIGYKATMEADSGYWWQDAIIRTFENGDGSTIASVGEGASSSWKINISVDTDIDDYVYPVITFTTGNSGGNVMMFNLSDESDELQDEIHQAASDFTSAFASISSLTTYLEKIQAMVEALDTFVKSISKARMVALVNIPPQTTIRVDSRINSVLGPAESQYNALGNLVHRSFPRLVDGDNEFFIVGDVETVTAEYQNRRML